MGVGGGGDGGREGGGLEVDDELEGSWKHGERRSEERGRATSNGRRVKSEAGTPLRPRASLGDSDGVFSGVGWGGGGGGGWERSSRWTSRPLSACFFVLELEGHAIGAIQGRVQHHTWG